MNYIDQIVLMGFAFFGAFIDLVPDELQRTREEIREHQCHQSRAKNSCQVLLQKKRSGRRKTVWCHCLGQTEIEYGNFCNRIMQEVNF